MRIRTTLLTFALSIGSPVAAAQSTDRSQPKQLTLSGLVLLEDGTPPVKPAKVELLCNSRVILTTQTRTEGAFHFRLGEERRSSDLSASSSGPDNLEQSNRGLGGLKAGGELRESGDGRFDLTNCEIRLSPMPGVEAQRITLGIQSVFDRDVGVIVLRKKASVRGTTVSVTTLEAPKDARKSFEKAQKDLAKRNPNYGRAQKRLEKAIALYPEFAEAWTLLGEARLGSSDLPGARQAFEQAAEADPNFIKPFQMLAGIELEKLRYREALIWTAKLIELDPGQPKTRYYDGLANYSLGQYAPALESLSVIDEGGFGSDYPAALLMLGDILARRGEIRASAARLRRYLEIGDHSPEMGQRLRRQLEDWEAKGLIDPVEEGQRL